MTTLIPDTYTGTEPWETRGACGSLDPELFTLPGSGSTLPEDHRYTDQITQAKAACATCPVTAQCLTAALAVPRSQDRWAIAGNTTPAERNRMRRAQQPSRQNRRRRRTDRGGAEQ